jgi:hypothetical protein
MLLQMPSLDTQGIRKPRTAVKEGFNRLDRSAPIGRVRPCMEVSGNAKFFGIRNRLKARILAMVCVVTTLLVPPTNAAELKSETAAAFDRYIRATEKQIADDLPTGHFLLIDSLPAPARQQIYTQLRQGQIYIEQLHTKEDGKPIQVPVGLIHHWVGVAFIPGGTLSRTVFVLQDYDNHKRIYKPDVRQSKLLQHQGNEFKVYPLHGFFLEKPISINEASDPRVCRQLPEEA